MVEKVKGFIKMMTSPVVPSPRLELIDKNLPLRSHWRVVMVSSVGSLVIFVRTGVRKTATIYLALIGILADRAGRQGG